MGSPTNWFLVFLGGATLLSNRGEKGKGKGEKEEKGSKGGKKVEEKAPTVAFKHKSRVLVLASRGITFRERHLMEDLRALMPHSKKDAKMDKKDRLSALNEIAEIKNCNRSRFNFTSF